MSKKSPIMDHCTFRFNMDLSKKLNRHAVSHNATKTQIIVTAIDQYLSREDDIEILYRDLRRLHNRVDTAKKSADLSVEIMLQFVKKFYVFVELYEKDHGRSKFKKEPVYEKFLDEVFDVMLTQGLFSERLAKKEEVIING